MRDIDVEEKLYKIMMELWGDDYCELPLDASLTGEWHFDSIGMVNLQVMIEDEFDIRFDPTSVDLTEVFVSLSSIKNYLISLLQE